VDKVCKKNGGSALLRQPSLALDITRSVVRSVDLPVTVKLRLGWDSSSIVAPTLARELEAIGVAGLIVHGRTAEQHFRGSVDLAGIARVVEAVRSIPVIGNGDVRSPEDASAMIHATGCAGVMIGRAALGDPWIFPATHAYLTTGRIPPPPSRQDRIDFMNQHFENLLKIRGERRACITFRQRTTWYLRKIGMNREFQERMRELSSAQEYYDLVGSLLDETGIPAGA